MKIALNKPVVTDEMKQVVLTVMDSGRYVKGPEVEQFEHEFAQYCGAAHAVSMNSGTAALYCALRAIGVQEGDEIILPSLTFFATIEPIIMLGATPVFVDVNFDYLMRPDLVKKAITDRTKAIIPVQLYGQMCNMTELERINAQADVWVIEDAAQSVGARHHNLPGTRWADISCYSFFPSKNMTVLGEGGMCVTNDDVLAHKLRQVADHGRPSGSKYEHHEIGFNFRMSELSAAIGREQLKYVDKWITAKRRNADLYYDALVDVVTPTVWPWSYHTYHQFVIRVAPPDREPLRQYLAERGIETGIHYKTPVHLQTMFRSNWLGRLPETETIVEQIISLPMHPELTDSEVSYVCDAIKEYYRA